MSEEPVYESNIVCPSAACGDRQTVLVSGFLLKCRCKTVNHLTLHVTPYALLALLLVPWWTFFFFFLMSDPFFPFFLWTSCSILAPSLFSFFLSACRHLIITFLFKCLSFFLTHR